MLRLIGFLLSLKAASIPARIAHPGQTILLRLGCNVAYDRTLPRNGRLLDDRVLPVYQTKEENHRGLKGDSL
jgi:hypothetical protein